MKIISWNVNGIRAVERKEALQAFLKDHSPDILVLQETKAKPEQLSAFLTDNAEYETFYVSAEKGGYSGVSAWVKRSLNIGNVHFVAGMPEDPVANEGRIVRVDFEKEEQAYTVLGTYFPNGGKSEEAWAQKLVFYEKWLDYVNTIRSENRLCLWGGDVNCAHNEIDLARPKDNDGVIGFHPKERAWLDKWTEAGWCDIWRSKKPEVRDVYSWWHMISKARDRNVGWRIDYFFVDETFLDQVIEVFYLNDQMGSDHCPVGIEIK